jgi:four helix bundle protein
VSDFKKLRVWEKARELAQVLYRETRAFPDSERYGLTSQMRRAVASVGSNIAEGCGRSGESEKARFFQIATGSLSELEFQSIIAGDLVFLGEEELDGILARINELGVMLGALTNVVRAHSAASSK